MWNVLDPAAVHVQCTITRYNAGYNAAAVSWAAAAAAAAAVLAACNAGSKCNEITQ